MDRKRGNYVVNVEPSGKQAPSMGTHGQEAQHPSCWHPPSNDITGNVSSNLSGVWVSPGILAHSECQHPEPCRPQVAGNSCGDWSLWKVFLACLLASVLTTAIGVLILSLVNRNNSPIVIQLSPNTEALTVTPQTTSTTSQTTAITSTGLTTTSPEATTTTATLTSTEPAGTSTAVSTEASTTTTMAMTSTQPVTTTATTTTPSVPTSTATSTQPTTSPASAETSATTIDSTQPETTSGSFKIK
ncbi:dynactin-associated protein-like [Mastomys coucha]|uniref:dynactin-associated protein-like n=1 Tax=Mastomys coucha TaxID=35658 RepID=UPI001261E8D6|nr:dynactin-associated protein-like [Mastomys coucha]